MSQSSDAITFSEEVNGNLSKESSQEVSRILKVQSLFSP